MQRHRRINALLVGILAPFMLTSAILILMRHHKINLLTQQTLLSCAFTISETREYLVVRLLVLGLTAITAALLYSPLSLSLHSFGDNETLFIRYGFSTELTRCFGFSLINILAASSGCLIAQVVDYAHINMELGMILIRLRGIFAGEQGARSLLK